MPELAHIPQRIAQAGKNIQEHGRQAVQHVVQKGKDIKQTLQHASHEAKQTSHAVAQTVNETPQLISDTLRPERAKNEANEFNTKFDIMRQLRLSPAQGDLFRTAFALELLKHTPGELQAKRLDGEENEVHDMDSQSDRGQQRILMEMVGQTRHVIAEEISTEIGKKMVRNVRGAGQELADIYLLRLQENVQDYEIADAVKQIAQRMGAYDLQQHVSDIWEAHKDAEGIPLKEAEIPLREPDHAIEELKRQRYSKESPRTSFSYIGEKAALRSIDPTDREDMRRMKEMTVMVQNRDFFYKTGESDTDVITTNKRLGEDDAYFLFGIAGNEGVKRGEKGELQGWVYVYEADDIDKKVARGVISQPQEGQDVLEVAYLKHPDAPPGQIASGLRQSCQRTLQLYLLQKASEQADTEFGIPTIDHNQIRAELGIDDPEAELSSEQQEAFNARVQELRIQSVLSPEQRTEYNERVGEIVLSGEIPKPIITATISPRNPESMLVATAAGFKRAETPDGGKVEGMSDPEDYMYVLDWNQFEQRVDQKAFPQTTAQAKSKTAVKAA